MTRTNTRIIGTTVAATLALTTLSACGGSSESDGAGLLSHIESGKVTLGTKFDQPGLGIKESNGEMSGLDVDIAQYVVNHIADAKGWKHPDVEWRETPSAQRETLIQNGEVDLIAATYSINKSRAESVNFGGPYLLTHQALLVRKDDSGIKEVKDLEHGKILCSVSGSTPAQKVKESLPGVQLQEYDTYSSCVEALRQGNVDALTTDATILNGYSQQNEGSFKVVEMFKDDRTPYTDEHYGIGLKKDDMEATKAVNEALDQLNSSGEFEKLVKKNLGDAAAGVTSGKPGDLTFIK
ncbi:glutamate ABC transporter substrate-binding protein [Corynebacterium ulcerans]|uniref:Glutamate-binding protein n=1 Tax=Corynebacterium ulcerans TaxID=65058 RepID=A0ABD0BIN8_CORUL|nr:glutamate ABC transporter substrate-binding protein [Corynebacterium ulcerans]KPH77254.1 glutamate-binding protein [Corynebacterium ulcerans]MBL4944208.1 glutamate ABC transporter substrate-binding protein [Corynebacterium ulcerans]OIS07225.1 glutamate-binding protein [Corynebacterium ulcerans]QGZ25124.1 transporter substrate-binding domain-containing protein [Corynebacterium ulcerans]QOE23834.1 glutamate ABC transporter substrate-binding protein [Corynebacterium ulcerans]